MFISPHRIILLLLALQLLSTQSALSQDFSQPEVAFEKANTLYSQGNFMQAIDEYNAIVASHGMSPELMHNLANSYAAIGNNGQAILHYLRGLHLSPGDDDLEGDLATLRKNIGLFTDSSSLKNQLLSLYEINQWCYIALICFATVTFCTIVGFFSRNRNVVPFFIFLFTTFSCLSTYAAFQQYSIWDSGVIVSPDTRLLMSPFDSAASLGAISEGSVVFLEKKHGDYLYIQDRTGRTGWIPSKTYKKINTHHLTYGRINN